MSFCCENPIDLGCRSACAPITTNIVQTIAGYYTIAYKFAGSLITREFYATPVGGVLQIPANIFNESQNVTFSVFDSNKVQIACYKATMLPSNSTLQSEEPNPLQLIDTSISIDGQNVECSNGLNIDAVTILATSGLAGLKVGTIYNMNISVIHGGNPHPYSLYYDQALTIPILNNKIIQMEINPIQSPLFYVATQLSNCNQNYTLSVIVDSMENMEQGYANGTNIGDTWTKS